MSAIARFHTLINQVARHIRGFVCKHTPAPWSRSVLYMYNDIQHNTGDTPLTLMSAVFFPTVCIPSCQLELPYFNLADGEKTKSTPLLIEIILCESRKKHLTRSSIGRRNGENSCLPPARPRMTNSSDGHHRLRRDSPGSLRILAVGTIDVQTWLAKRRNTSAEDPESEQISLLVAKGGVDTPLAFAPPESVFVWVRLAFSKAFLPDRLEEMVPVAFVVATTLFDCAVTIEEAELQLYARDGDTGDMSCVSRGRGGKIGKHAPFFSIVKFPLLILPTLASATRVEVNDLSRSRNGSRNGSRMKIEHPIFPLGHPRSRARELRVEPHRRHKPAACGIST